MAPMQNGWFFVGSGLSGKHCDPAQRSHLSFHIETAPSRVRGGCLWGELFGKRQQACHANTSVDQKSPTTCNDYQARLPLIVLQPSTVGAVSIAPGTRQFSTSPGAFCCAALHIQPGFPGPRQATFVILDAALFCFLTFVPHTTTHSSPSDFLKTVCRKWRRSSRKKTPPAYTTPPRDLLPTHTLIGRLKVETERHGPNGRDGMDGWSV